MDAQTDKRTSFNVKQYFQSIVYYLYILLGPQLLSTLNSEIQWENEQKAVNEETLKEKSIFTFTKSQRIYCKRDVSMKFMLLSSH